MGIINMYLYGASGHARVIRDALLSQGIEVHGFVDDNPDITEFDGLPVYHSSKGISHIIVSIGDCHVRKKIIGRLGDVEYGIAIHSRAIISNSVTVNAGSVVMAGAIIQPSAIIGRHSIVNTGASIDHDCVIGDFVHIAPHCTLCGSVSIGECTWIGAGAIVIQGVHIGNNCYIGAGSVVLNDIPDNYVAYGNPCRIIRENQV